eukprot:5607855-Amphidinium_carterae.2
MPCGCKIQERARFNFTHPCSTPSATSLTLFTIYPLATSCARGRRTAVTSPLRLGPAKAVGAQHSFTHCSTLLCCRFHCTSPLSTSVTTFTSLCASPLWTSCYFIHASTCTFNVNNSKLCQA